MQALVAFNQFVAELFGGYLPGRPTISERTGRRLDRFFGFAPGTGKRLFHGVLAVLAVVAAVIVVVAFVVPWLLARRRRQSAYA